MPIASSSTFAGTCSEYLPLLILAVPAVFALLFALDLAFNGLLARQQNTGNGAPAAVDDDGAAAPAPPAGNSPAPLAGATRALGIFAAAAPLFIGLFALAAGGHFPIAFGGSAGATGPLGVAYPLVLDGRSLLLVLLTGIVAPAALFASRKLPRPLALNTLFLLMESAALGVFLSKNFFAWFLFWELSLVPAFFLIKLWGGAGADRAAMRFVVYTVGGSAFMLAAFAALYAATGTWDFRSLETSGAAAALHLTFGPVAPWLVFGGITLGLAVKVPLFPFHSWLPDAYAEAPAGVSMFLTGVMSKMGVFGFLAILAPVLPAQLAAAAPVLLWLALGGVLLGAFAALRQRDIKRMIAYSSVNHLGYCLLALFAAATAAGSGQSAPPPALLASADAALNGAWLQVFNHGLSASALFFCAGIMEDRAGTRGLDGFGGARKVAPVFALLCGAAVFSSLGLPGLNGFPGEFMIFRGVFGLAPWAAALALPGLLATAVFLLEFWRRVFHGPVAGATPSLAGDATGGERVVLGVLAALMLLFGVRPQLLLDLLGAGF